MIHCVSNLHDSYAWEKSSGLPRMRLNGQPNCCVFGTRFKTWHRCGKRLSRCNGDTREMPTKLVSSAVMTCTSLRIDYERQGLTCIWCSTQSLHLGLNALLARNGENIRQQKSITCVSSRNREVKMTAKQRVPTPPPSPCGVKSVDAFCSAA